MKRPLRSFCVDVGGRRYVIRARTPAAAARRAFRQAIAERRIKKQPKSELDGGWEGVKISLAPPPSATMRKAA